MAQYVAPETFAGKNIQQLQKEGLLGGRPDLIAGLLGVSQDQLFTSGQQFNVNFEPGHEGSLEKKSITSGLTPYGDFLSAKQKSEDEGFLSALNAKIGGQETLTAASGRIGGELGLPALRKSAQDLTATLSNIPQTQQTIAKQVGISAPNLEKRIASEQGRLAPAAQKAVTQQQYGEQELGTQLGLLLQDQAKELEPFYQAQLPLLSDRLAREQSNYQLDKQNELDILLTKMSQGFQATQAELDRANQLAVAEKQYTQVKNSQSIETIGGRKVLVTYDNSGNVIGKVDLGSSGGGLSTIDGW